MEHGYRVRQNHEFEFSASRQLPGCLRATLSNACRSGYDAFLDTPKASPAFPRLFLQGLYNMCWPRMSTMCTERERCSTLRRRFNHPCAKFRTLNVEHRFGNSSTRSSEGPIAIASQSSFL